LNSVPHSVALFLAKELGNLKTNQPLFIGR
jgi:hypothetical protein